MTTIEERNKKFYTSAGLIALENKIKTYIKIFNKNLFPFSGEMLGFGEINLDNQKECLARILEISNLTGFKAKLNMDKATGVSEIKY